MTREEAIEYLKRADLTVGQEIKTKMAEALEMAISALETKGDLISRQAVINAIANTCFWLSADNWEELIKCINSISHVENKGDLISKQEALKPYEKLNDTDVISVWLIRKNLEEQEAVNADMRINRKNCEYRHENGNCLKVGGFCTSVDDEHCMRGRNMSDLISRQEALKPYEKLNDNDVISVWLIRKTLEEQEAIADIMECARIIKEYCESHEECCAGCPFESTDKSACELSRMMFPCEWFLPEGGKANMRGKQND